MVGQHHFLVLGCKETGMRRWIPTRNRNLLESSTWRNREVYVGLCMSTLWRPCICKAYWNKLLWSKESHFVSTWLRSRSTTCDCLSNDRRWVDSRSVVRLSVEQVLLHEEEMCFPRRAATVEMGNDRCVGGISRTTKTSTPQQETIRREILSWIFCVRYSFCRVK